MASNEKLTQIIIELPDDNEPRPITARRALIIIGPPAYLASGDFVKRNKIPIDGASEKSRKTVDLQGTQYLTNGYFHATYRLPDDFDVRLVLFEVVVQDCGFPEDVDLLLSLAENAAIGGYSGGRDELNMLVSPTGQQLSAKDRQRLLEAHKAKLAEEEAQRKEAEKAKAESKTPRKE